MEIFDHHGAPRFVQLLENSHNDSGTAPENYTVAKFSCTARVPGVFIFVLPS